MNAILSTLYSSKMQNVFGKNDNTLYKIYIKIAFVNKHLVVL